MADWTGEARATAEIYLAMADISFDGVSPSYQALARGVAADGRVIALLDSVPAPKRQPNLLFGAVRYLGGPLDDVAAFLDWVAERWADVESTIMTRRTQTNEAGRCATLLPELAALPQPLALLEVGASAGLCLLPDHYAYRYLTSDGVHAVGAADLTLGCEVTGPAPLPDRLPDVVWRAGLDLNPLDVNDPDDVRWLESLVWPEQVDRFDTLRAAVQIARQHPPRVVEGSLLTDLEPLVHDAPVDATLVVFHSAVLAYLGAAERDRFIAAVRGYDRDVVWISNEAPGIAADLTQDEAHSAAFVLARDGRPLAWTGPHGHTLDWLADLQAR